MKTIVLTGGPHSGKTEILNRIKCRYANEVCALPEVATGLLKTLFPNPGKDLKWSQEWQDYFEKAILSVQLNYEEAWKIVAHQNKAKMMVLDRAVLDGAAYLNMDVQSFCNKYNFNLKAIYARYDLVFHLESVAICNPKIFGLMGNENRFFENIQQACQLDRAIRSVWSGHPNWVLISGKKGIDDVEKQVLEKIKLINE